MPGRFPSRTRDRCLAGLARLTYRFPITVLTLALLTTAAAGLYASAKLEFHSGRDDLVSSRGRYNELYNDYTRDFGDLDHLVVVAQSEDVEQAKQFVTALAAELEQRRDLVKEVFYRVNTGTLGDTALLYLSRDDLTHIGRQLHAHRTFLEDFSLQPTLNTFFDLVNREISKGMVSYLVGSLLGVADDAESEPVDLTLLTATLRQLGTSLRDPRAYVSPWDRFLSSGKNRFSQDGFLVTEGRRFVLLLIDLQDEGRERLDEIRELTHTVAARFPGLEAGLTGAPALNHAERETTKRDVELASILALASNVLLLVLPFRAIVKPAFAMLTLIVGSVWSFGLATLVIGHLNLLSAVFTSILFGIGINFPIHLTARYQEARRLGLDVAPALETSLVNTGRGVVAAAAIMMLAFCTPVLVSFRGVAELGIVSALGLLSCLLASLTVYPALVALEDRGRSAPAAGLPVRADTEPVGGSTPRWLRRPRTVLALTLVASILPWPFFTRISFDENILRLQPERSEAVQYELKLLREAGRSTTYAVSIAPTLAEARRRQAVFEALPTVHEVHGIDDLVPGDQAAKRAILAGFAPLLDGLPPLATPDPPAVDRLRSTLRSIDLKLSRGEGDGGWDPARKPEPESLDEARALLAGVRAEVEAAGEGSRVAEALGIFQARLAADFADKLAFLRRNLAPREVTIDDIPATLREGLIGKSGRYLLQIYARDDIWEPTARASFIADLRRVDLDVTGGPVQAHEVTQEMKVGYLRAAVWSFVAIFVLVLVDLRNVREALLAMVPLAVGTVWTLELMAACGISFNLANLFAVPLIIGMGVDNGVNMIYRFREDGARSFLLSTAVGKSVTLCSLTTIAGFGALVLADHNGIASLGLLLTIGVSAILVATVVVLPAVLAWLTSPAVQLPPMQRRPRLEPAHRHQRPVVDPTPAEAEPANF
jgi:hopanoid biosynthesis associated RND transporter like protein HpnN